MKPVGRFEYGLRVVWLSCWISIPQNIVGILTLGYYVPHWDVNWMFWACQRWYRGRSGL